MPQEKLKKYRSMRDFSQTAEPSGAERGRKAPKSRRLRFVVQKHDATRLHYDFRLELDGTFKSWAVTKGPSPDPADKRLAVEVEDHPLEYGDFEGTIPKGQYGGGTVQLWDRGYWEPENDPEEGLKKGDLKFTLDGDRLHGSWVLVRIKHNRDRNSKRTNWLLIKHRDQYAREGGAETLLAEDRSVASGRAMATIAAGKGRGPKPFMLKDVKALRIPAAAVWDTSAKHPKKAAVERAPAPAKKTRHATMPDFIAPQLATAVDRPPHGANWVHEVKFDGYRIQLRVEDGEARLRTRKGLDWTEKFPEIAEACSGLPDGIYDGEICAVDKNGAPDFSALQAALSEGKTEKLIYFLFDLLMIEGEDIRKQPLVARKERLRDVLGGVDASIVRYVDHLETGGEALLQSAAKMGLEGIISKEAKAPYRSERGSSWVKAKVRAGQEVVIGAWWGDAQHLRSLFVGVRKGSKLVYAGKVGTGYSAEKAKRVLPHLRKIEVKESPFVGPNAPRGQSDIHWVKPELVAEVEFAGWTPDGMVRQAAFKDLRLDKPASEVVAELPADPEEVDMPAPKGKAKTKTKTAAKVASSSKPEVMGVTISNPEKAMWPEADGDGEKVTKLDLARFYEDAGPWMIEHIRGIPCSVVRAPDGFNKEQFFQRHSMLGMSKLLDETKVSGDRKPYLTINRVEGLAAVAQMGGLELHPWNCAPGQPDVPGRLVFDLDPAPDVDFADVTAAAKTLKDWLEMLGLVAFCKTTGGKGLHVVTPLEPEKGKLDWPAAKGFAHDVCEAIATDAPDKYLVNMAKAKRGGRIFLDYLRNDRMSTAVGPLSPRARAGATVSMPLTWAQVKAGLDPTKYTVRTAMALLRKSKAWSDYAKGARPLLPAIQRLEKAMKGK
ncbi:MAG TPA: DNA ligase D [Candidatus Cybelea sp.]|nr:DNA ligase D [Candidatus Cybelea sp.]